MMSSLPRITAPRIYADLPIKEHELLDLPEGAVRHIQVLRMQPQHTITLFNGQGGQWLATIIKMGRNHVQVQIQKHEAIEREANTQVTLLIGIPANERMDFLIEKTTELGVFAIYPLIFERSVIKLQTQRAQKKWEHWKAIAIAACEQCGRNQIPQIHPVMTLANFLQNTCTSLPDDRRVLSLQNARSWSISTNHKPVCLLSGPEGGLTLKEEDLLISQEGFIPYSLGNRVLRADTAPLAALSTFTI